MGYTPSSPLSAGSADPDPNAPALAAPLDLPERAVIERPTVARNSLLGQTANWAYVATLPCRLLKPTSPGEKVEGGMLSARMVWPIQFKVGADVRATDRATISGEVYTVTETDEGLTDAPVLTAFAIRLR